MTVAAGSVVLGPFIPNGSVTDWPFTFTAYADAEVVPRLVTASGSTIPSHVTTRNNFEDITASGGVVVIDPPLAAGSGKLYLSYIPSFEQETEFADQDRWSPTVMNYALDRAASRDQHMDGKLDRAQKAPLGELAPPIPSEVLRAGTVRVWSSDGSAERTDISIDALLALVGGSGGGSGTGTLSLAGFIDPSLALTDAQIAAYPNKTGWIDVTSRLRLALSTAATLGLTLSYGGLTGNFYINPLSPLLVGFGSGYDGGAFSYPTLDYASNGAGNINDVVSGGGLNWIVDPLDTTTRKIPKFALQGRVTVKGLSIIGVGLSKSRLIQLTEPSGYTPITGGDEFFTDAPVIVTDHQHDRTGTYTGPGHNNKAGNITLDCSVLGLMQAVYIGDPHPTEEPLWSGYCASGLVTGTGGNNITVYTGPALRGLGLGRKTSTRQYCRVVMEQPRWTGITQPNSGKLDDYSWIKFVQQFGVAIDAWHRAVGFDWIIEARGIRYGYKLQAGYSSQGPTWAEPTVGATVAVDDLVSAANGDAFMCTVTGPYQTRPQSSGANYNATTGIFTDPASTVRWLFMCRQPDTGKYNAGRISVAGERIIQAGYVHINAFMANVEIKLSGHFMDEYALKTEAGPALDIRSHYLLAGSIDKAVYTAWVGGHAYDYGDKISDGSGNVWAVTAPGTSTTIPTLGGATNGRFSDGADLKWIFRNAGWKPFGDQPYARVTVAGIVDEISGPLFRNTKYDGHQSFTFNGCSTAAWSQATKTEPLIVNKSFRTSIKHINSQTYVSGKSDRIYDVVDEARLHVGVNDYYGYDLSAVAAGSYPLQIGNNTLSATFFDFKNCMAHDFDYAVPDEPEDDS